MTVNETLTLIEILAATYPNQRNFSDPQQAVKTAKVWASLMPDIPAKVAIAAVQKHCMLNKFPPTPAEIRAAAVSVTNPKCIPDAAEAWGEVVRAVRNFGYYREEEALASLPPLVAKVTRSIGWKDICLSEEPDVLRGQFRMAYNQYQEREKEQLFLPESFKEKIVQLGDSMKFLED